MGLALDALSELKQRMAFLERALASARMGHFWLDPERASIEFSPWVRANMGLDDEPVPLERLPDIVVGEDRERVRSILEGIVAGQDDFAFEATIITAKGMARTQQVTGIAAFEDEESRTGFVGFHGILQEVTSQKEAEQDLLEARDEARAELAARTNILATVSHEIRTPLGGVLGLIDQLKRENSAVERERALALIEDSCEVLLDTLDAILQQSRLDQNADGLVLKPFSPRALANRVAELFRPVARRKALRVEVNATSDGEAMGDAARIQQVLANLVSNAVKFTQAGAITIFVQEPAAQSEAWSFVVSDTGSGMDERRLANLFEPFGASSDDTLGKAGGAGLGLSITRDLVEAMGGRIEVESEVGKGTSFSVAIPLAPPPQTVADTLGNGERGCVVLMVDRASDKVQAEAVATQFGFSVCELDAHSDPKLPSAGNVTVIVDAAFLGKLGPDILEASREVVVLGDDPGFRAGETEANLVFVSHSHLARSLGEVFEAQA